MLDQQFEILANEQRRVVLTALLTENPQERPHTLGELTAEYIDEEPLPVELFHIHLPKLEQAGYIEWDRTSHTVGKGPSFAEIRPLLTLLNRDTRDLLASGA